MWNDRKSWWSKKAEDNQGSKTHYKNWCVIKVAVAYRHHINSWTTDVEYAYKAVARANAPTIYTAEGKMQQAIEVDNLTTQEAHHDIYLHSFLPFDSP